MRIAGKEVPLAVLGAGIVSMLITAVIVYKTQKKKITKMSLPKKLGVVVGPAVAVGGAVMIGIFMYRKRKEKKAMTSGQPDVPTTVSDPPPAPSRKKRRADMSYAIRESPGDV